MIDRTDILIVGAGPAGLAAALTLARRGVDFLLVDRKPALSDLPRATGVSTRSMELFRAWGIEDQIRAGGTVVAHTIWACLTLAEAADGVAVPTGWPTRAEAALVSPTAPALVPQDHVERAMLDQVRALGGRVRFGTELTDLRPDGATLRDVATGATTDVEARYVIGADGTRSSVRRALGIDAPPQDGAAAVVTAQFRAPLWDLVGDRRHVLYRVTDPAGQGIFVPAGDGDRWVYAVDWDPARESLADYPAERLTALLAAGAGDPALRPRIDRIGAFAYISALADSFRDGNVFLAGDAAHRVTPRGATGMNMALHDGFDLGWKLAWVTRGWADDDLLDSYEEERRPVAARNVAESAKPTSADREVTDELQVDLGGRLRHVWLPGGGRRVSTLDLLGPGYTLFAAVDAPAWHRAAAQASEPPITAHTVGGLAARALGVHPRGALLVRPDGVLVASATAHEMLRSDVLVA